MPASFLFKFTSLITYESMAFLQYKSSYQWRHRWPQGSSEHCHSGCINRSCSPCRVVNLWFVKRCFLSDLKLLGEFSNSSVIFMVPLSSHMYIGYKHGPHFNSKLEHGASTNEKHLSKGIHWCIQRYWLKYILKIFKCYVRSGRLGELGTSTCWVCFHFIVISHWLVSGPKLTQILNIL